MDSVDAPRTTPRPAGIKLIMVLGYVEALVVLAAAAALGLGRDEPEVADEFDAGPDVLLGASVVLALLAVCIAVVATLLGRGSERIRSLYGVLTTVQVALAVYSLIALRDLRVASVWALALPTLVLWILYGSERTQEFFGRAR